MSAPILVTGASGNTGREVLRALRERALPFRAGVRRTGAPPEVALDFRGPRTWDEALQGCRGVFFLRPPAIADVEETLLPFVDRARTLGAEQVVFLSVAGAEKNSFVPHHAVEKHLQAKEAPFTILRPGFFAQNLQDAYLREDDRLIVPAGRAGPPSSICTTSPTWPPRSSPSPPPSSRQRPRGADFAEEALCELPRRRSEKGFEGTMLNAVTTVPPLRIAEPRRAGLACGKHAQ